MQKEISLSFPEKQSLGSLYTAEQLFPHVRKWVGEARGNVALKYATDRMLGVALSALGWEGLAKTDANQLNLLESLDVSTCQFSQRSFESAQDLKSLLEIRLDYLKVGDADIRLLRRFTSLKTLWAYRNKHY